MKYLLIVLLAVGFASSCSSSKSASTAMSTANFEVRGLCGMCKSRIESTALSTKGVKKAAWDDTTQMLTINYNPSKTSVEKVQQNIANVGHDTQLFKAPNAVYDRLPACCHYDRKQ